MESMFASELNNAVAAYYVDKGIFAFWTAIRDTKWGTCYILAEVADREHDIVARKAPRSIRFSPEVIVTTRALYHPEGHKWQTYTMACLHRVGA